MATNRFIDSVNGSNGNNGTTMDLAWQTIAYAAVSGALSTDYTVWMRRNIAETPGAIFTMTYDGTPIQPIRFIGWPRNTITTTGNFTNGSSTVSGVAAAMARLPHESRNMSGPDGKAYWIEKVTDANTIVLNREYAGPDSAGGSFTISADEDYTEAQAIDDSTWTIKKAAWSADADNIASLDFNGASYYWYFSSALNVEVKNLEMKNGGLSGIGTIRTIKSFLTFVNCLFYTNTNALLLYLNGGITCLINCIFEGTAAGSSNWLYYGTRNNSYFLRCGFRSAYYHLYPASTIKIKLIDCNIGILGAASSLELQTGQQTDIYLSDVNAVDNFNLGAFVPAGSNFYFENYGRTKGLHKDISVVGTIQSNDCSGADVNRRTGGSSRVIDCLFNGGATYGGVRHSTSSSLQFAKLVFEHVFTADTTSRTYRYYVQSVTDALTANELWLECEYIDSYEDSSEYTTTFVSSDETITARADADDWGQYIEVTGIAPAVASNVIIRCFCTKYHATNKRYVDPEFDKTLSKYKPVSNWELGQSKVIAESLTPTITDISPTSGDAGDNITITGTNFLAAGGTVTCGGLATAIVSWADTTIIASTSSSLSLGSSNDVVVTNSLSLSVTAPSSFTIGTVSPALTSITPDTGSQGTLVTLVGTNFGTSGASFIGNVRINEQSHADTKIVGTLSQGMTAGLQDVYIYNAATDRTGISTDAFTTVVGSESTARAKLRAAIKYGLEQITTTNGYRNTIKRVYDPPKSMEQMVEYSCVNMIWGQETRSGEHLGSANDSLLDLRFDFTCECYLKSSDPAQAQDNIIADLQTYFGSRHWVPSEAGDQTAFDCVYLSSNQWGWDEQKGICGVDVVFEIAYRIRTNNPESLV